MFSRARTVAILAALAVSTTRASAEILQPAGNWVLDYRDDQCLASRDYGRPEKPVTLGVRPAPNGETYELLVSQPHAGPEFATELKGAVDFGPGPIKAWLLSYGGRITKSIVYQFRVSAADMAQASSAETVTFRPQGAPNLTFALRSMPALLNGLQECTRDLKRYWNVNGDQDGSIVTPAKGDVRSVFTTDDYPADASQHNQGGSSQFLLLVDEKGLVAGCHVLKPSGVPVLDAMGCQVIRRRTKFIPARGQDGKPIRSTVTTPPVVWRLEG